MCSARRRSRWRRTACASSPPATTSAAPIRPAKRSSRSPATSSSPRRPSRFRSSAIPTTAPRSESCSPRSRQFPDRTHLVGAYALGKAQRVIALIREAGYDEPIYIHGALQKLCDLYRARGDRPRPTRAGDARQGQASTISPARSSSARPPPSPTAGRAASPIRSPASPPAGCASASAPRQGGVELPLVISDHADWDELCDTIREIAPQEVWVTHGREEALVRWCELQGIPAKPLHLMGYEEEPE